MNRSPFPFLSGISLILAIGLRLEVGGDWYEYLNMFNFLQRAELGRALFLSDPGYALVNWVVGWIGLGIWGVNLVCATIFTVGLLSLCRQQPNPPLAILTAIPYLVIVVAMGYTRQSAALGFIMLALSQYFRGATIQMLFSLTLAAAFHKSAVIIIPMLALASARQRMATFLTLVLLAATTYYLFLAGATDRLIANYIGARYTSSGATIRLTMNLVPAMLLLVFWRRFGFDRQQLRLWTTFAIASLVALVALFVSPSSAAVDRLALYLIPLQIVVLSRLPSCFGTPQRQSQLMIALVVVYSLAIEIVWLNFAQFSYTWLPYRNYLWAPADYIETTHRG